MKLGIIELITYLLKAHLYNISNENILFIFAHRFCGYRRIFQKGHGNEVKT